MASLVERISGAYNSVMYDLRDPRMDSYWLMGSPFPTAAICLSYVAVVCWLGPRWMRDRRPYHVQKLIVAYNAFQVVFSTWLFFKILFAGWWRDYSYACQPVDYSNTPKALKMVDASWWYFFSKFTEFPDTFFFIARKKFEHVSVLHVVHHGLMPFSVWWGAKFIPGGHSTFFGLANSFVHIFMYIYYMLAAMGPKYKKYIWWKKHMTNLQMVQFVAIAGHSFQLVFRECDYPTVAFWYIGAHGVLFFALFSGFYKKEYFTPKPKKDDGAAPITNGKASNGHMNGYTNGYTNGVAKENGTKSAKLNGHGVLRRGAALNTTGLLN